MSVRLELSLLWDLKEGSIYPAQPELAASISELLLVIELPMTSPLSGIFPSSLIAPRKAE